MNIFLNLIKFLIGIILIPVSIAASVSFYREISNIKYVGDISVYFLRGAAFYTVLHIFLPSAPRFLYIFGHEFAHTIAVWICGGRVGRFRVSTRGGSVTTSKSNFFILLFPYIFPFYVIVNTLIYLILSAFLTSKDFLPYYIFSVGIALAFHIIFTVEFLKVRQPDVRSSGYIFSMTLIYMINIMIVMGILNFIFSSVSFVHFYRTTYSLLNSWYNFALQNISSLK